MSVNDNKDLDKAVSRICAEVFCACICLFITTCAWALLLSFNAEKNFKELKVLIQQEKIDKRGETNER